MIKKVIHIEICRSEYVKNKFNCRIGNIKGSTEMSNGTKEEIMREISIEIDELEELNQKIGDGK